MSTPMWVDDHGDPWIEIESGQVTWIGPAMRKRIKDKVGTEVLEDVQRLYGLRRLVPDGSDQDPEKNEKEESGHGPG